MTDFSTYRAAGLTLSDPKLWEEYTAWAASRVCGCGKKASDRSAAAPWATEEECLDCFQKRCAQRQP